MTTRNRELAGIIDDSGNITAGGNLTVSGTTTTVSSTVETHADPLIELNTGAGSNANDLGFVFERGSTGNNACLIWDESNDAFAVGTTTATGTSTGNMSYTVGDFLAGKVTVDNVLINGTTIGHTSDTDLITLADGVVTVAGEISVTTLDIGGTNVSSTAAELNILDGVNSTAAELNILDGVTATVAEINIIDGDTSATGTTLADADRVIVNDGGTMKQVALTDFETYFESSIDTFSTIDINGGSIDGATVGTNSAAAGSFTTLAASGAITGTLGTAAQTNITSLGTLTTLTVDNITINGQSISTAASNNDIILVPHGTGDVEVQSDSLLISATEGESASIVLRADESDDAGDDWTFTSNTSNTLTIGNDIASAGTAVAHITVTPHATVASSTTAIAGNLTAGGAITSLTNFNTTSGNDLRLNAGSANRDIFMQVNGTTMMTVQGSTSRVGIGIASPDGPLHVMSASAGSVAAHASADELVVEGSANAGINILSGNSNEGGIYFGDDGDNDIGRIRYDHSNNSLDFFANAAEKLSIGSTGTVTVTNNAVGTLTTDNDGSFDMAASNNFKCTPSGNFTLTFTNIVSQSGNILLVNSGGHTVSAHANTKVDASILATITAAGTYLVSYFSDGTNAYLTNSAIYT